MTGSANRRAAQALRLLGAGLYVAAIGASTAARAEETISVAPVSLIRPVVAQQIVDGVRPSTIRKLLEAGADPLVPDANGDTAMHIAAMVRDPAYLKLLLARGLNPDTRNAVSGRTPLIAAMLAERNQQVAMLLAAGANVALTDATGNTPLHVAAQINEPRQVLALLKVGAPTAARNAQNQTFQPYLFMTPDNLLTAETSRSRRAVISWLRQHGIALEMETP